MAHPLDPGIAARIRDVIESRRIALGLSPAQLGGIARVDDRQMKRVLDGKSGLSFESLARVAGALGWTLGELMLVAFPPRRRRRVRLSRESQSRSQ